MNALRIAQAQINTTVGDLPGNTAAIKAWIDRAKECHSDIVTFPELAICGYPPEDLLLKPGFLRDNLKALEAVAPACVGINVVVGFADVHEGKVYNAAAVLAEGRVKGIYHKIELPNYGVFDEKRYFEPGSDCLVLDMGGCRVSVAICEDIWIEGSAAERLTAANHVQIVLSISASPFFAGKFAFRRDNVIRRFAQTTGTVVCYNNLVGGQDELVFDGGSMVVDSRGRMIGCGKRFEEDLLVTDVPARASDGHPAVNIAYPSIALPSFRPLGAEPITRLEPEPSRVEEVYKALVLGTRDYVLKNGFSGVILGLSGGIDSALTAAIAVDALGREKVVSVTMPSQYTSAETFSDARLVAENLGIELITAAVKDIYDSYLQALEKPFRRGKPGTDLENLQARIRGNILMALSNRFGWLVLTTGNKSETAVGYCTLYGDMAGGFAVIKDVPKTLVYELAEYVNETAGREIIPLSVIVRPPTAELRPDQKDEDSLPPYAMLDPILKAYVEDDKAPEEIPGAPEVVRSVIAMVDNNEYKRRQAPPGVKITPKAFGRDRRMPLTNRYLKGVWSLS